MNESKGKKALCETDENWSTRPLLTAALRHTNSCLLRRKGLLEPNPDIPVHKIVEFIYYTMNQQSRPFTQSLSRVK